MGAEALAALFGVYGDVVRIKMLPEQEAALVEMEKPVQAYVAKWLLDASPLGGRVIKVRCVGRFRLGGGGGAPKKQSPNATNPPPHPTPKPTTSYR